MKRFYAVLIALVVGGFLVHNLLDYLKKVKAVYRRRQGEPSFPRMNLNERIQHAVLFASFFILILTGFALKFGWPLPGRSLVHRICGVILLADLFYHLVYMVVTARGRKLLRDFFPRWRDVREMRDYIAHLLGRTTAPRFGRFTYWEKMEYWSVVWGTLIMGGTGLLLWFENWSLGLLPKWGIDVATLIHFLEAILATLAVMVGHLYFVILNPDVFPISFSWLNGRIPRDQALKEHPDEYEGRHE